MALTNYPEYNPYEKVFKQTTTFLKRWNGGRAFIKTITTSHAALIIHIYKDNQTGFLELSCITPVWIKGFSYWENCELLLKTDVLLKNREKGYILIDEKNELEIHCIGFEIRELRKSFE